MVAPIERLWQVFAPFQFELLHVRLDLANLDQLLLGPDPSPAHHVPDRLWWWLWLGRRLHLVLLRVMVMHLTLLWGVVLALFHLCHRRPAHSSPTDHIGTSSGVYFITTGLELFLW